jgi:shikimate kinase
MNFKQSYLTAFMESCKSTVGRILADLLYCSFNDLDEFVTQKAGRPIPKIFKQVGTRFQERGGLHSLWPDKGGER